MRHEQVVSYRHSLVFLAIVAGVMALGFGAQQRSVPGGGLVETHAQVIPIYLSVTIMNWLLVLFVWKGIRKRGVAAASIIGGRWEKPAEVLRDLGLALVLWGILGASAWAVQSLLGEGADKSIDILLPRTAVEVMVWIATSASAGFCEEFVFRGYVQRQILALSQRVWVAVLGQGLVFGLMHAYQGWRAVLSITVLGVLFGTLAAWRTSLRPGMVAHAWQDVWAGWLSRLLVR